jgi:hypothetical protein
MLIAMERVGQGDVDYQMDIVIFPYNDQALIPALADICTYIHIKSDILRIKVGPG